jgi:cell cycle checkpoint protein MEC1
MSTETLQKLSEILDTLINQESPGKQRDSNSINALLTSVLKSYENRKLDSNLLLSQKGISENFIVTKIFIALRLMFARNSSLLIENNRHLTILKSTFPFFNCLNCSIELIDDALFALIQISTDCFKKGLLVYNRLIFQQRDFIFKYLDSLLNEIIKSFTNTSSSDFSNLDPNDSELLLKLISIETLGNINLSKISKISIVIKILQFLTHPAIERLYFVQHHSSFILDSYISKCWFCLENIIINIKFIPENKDIIGSLDNLYSTLLLSTVNYYYNDQTLQFNRLQLAVQSCHFLLNWPLLSNFEGLQIILAQSLFKLFINLEQLNNTEYFWSNIGLTESSVLYFTQIIKNLKHNELKNCLKILLHTFNVSKNMSDEISLNEISDFQTVELISLRKRMDSDFNFFRLNLTTEIISSFNQNGLSDILNNASSLTEIEITKTINTLGEFACYLSNNYNILSQTCRLCDSNHSISSYIIDNIDINRCQINLDIKMKEVYSVVEYFITKKIDTDNHNIIISLLITLTKIFRAYRPPQLDLKSNLWKFIESCFTHSLRQIRLLSVKLFPLFIYTPEDRQYEHNLDLILSYLYKFQPKKSNYYIFEGYITCLGELLIVKSIDTRYYIILNQLIKFMSDSDEFRSNMAIYVLRMVSNTKKITPWQVIEPFIPLLSRDIVKKRNSNPGILTNFCVAIEMNVSLFLQRTLKYTIPFLINYYKEDHISFISSTIKSPKSDLISSQLDDILAYLFVTYENISHNKILNILTIYDPAYKSVSFDELIYACKGPYFLYNLLYHYNSESETFERIKRAIGIISVTLKYGTEENEATQKMLGRWLLIIIQMISTTLNDKKGSNPYAVKIKAIKSVICLLKLCSKFEACLGQVITALQLALKYNELRTEILQCLKLIIESVNAKSLEFIFDPLLSQLIQQFNTFSEKNQILATEIIQLLIKAVPNQELSYRFALKKLPTMKHISFQHVPDRRLIADFRIRLRSDNKWVIEQVLDDLITYLHTGQAKYQQLVKDDELLLSSFLNIIEILVTNSFKNHHNNATNENTNNDSQISLKSAKVLSLLGNLDLTSSSSSSSIFKNFNSNTYDNVTNFLLVTNLQKQKSLDQETSTLEFSLHFLKNILVRAFVSSVDPEEQKFLAYTIQEYLSIFEIPPKIWDGLDDLTKNILEPLKVTRYKQKLKLNLVDFPIYKSNKDYSTWLKDITGNLLHTCAALSEVVFKSPPQITDICSIIPLLDISISKFILPYAILFLVVIEPENNMYKKQIQEEFMTLLQYDLNSINNEVIKENLKKCMVLILEIFQFLKAWNTKVKEEEDVVKTSNKLNSKIKKTGIQRVEKFLNSFPKNILAKRYAESDMHEGSLLFLEESYKEKAIEKDYFFSTLKDIYVQLEDYDQLHGSLKTFSTNSLNDKLLQFKYNEDTQVSNESLNAIAQYDFDDGNIIPDTNRSAIELFEVLNKNCEYDQLLLNLKNYELKIGGEKLNHQINPEWVLHGIQASIYTGDINDLEKWSKLSQETNSIAASGSDMSIYYEIAQGLISLKNLELPKCYQHIETAIKYIGLAISNSENIIHRKIPDYMILLHSLHDFKLMAKMDGRNDTTIQSLQRRLKISNKDFKSVWKIHSMKSSIYKLHPGTDFKELYIDSLVEGCKILRENNRLPQATKLITKALVLNGNDPNSEMTQASTLLMNVEFSKLFWAQNDYETALKNMSLVIDQLNVKNHYYLDFSLTYLHWLDISAEGSSDEIMKSYNLLLHENNFQHSAEVFYQYAVYLNKLLEAKVLEESDGSLDLSVIKYYFLAVRYSQQYVHETLPKAVTLWLDYYQKYLVPDSNAEISRKLIDNRNTIYHKVNLLVEKCISELGNKWYIVLSQIISRITHDDKKITESISKIIVELTIKYPWLLLYSVFAQARSVDNHRRTIGTKILTKLQDTRSFKNNQASQLPKLIASGLILLESIMSVCHTSNSYKHPKSGNLVKDLYKDLNFNYPRDSECLALALPIKYNMDLLYNLRNDVEKRVIFYKTFHDKVKILYSLQQPKRVKVTGTNGQTYFLLFKPRDDLRKDNKIMEFSTVMNGLLLKNHETQTRSMQINSFAATPLNETTGIIEWVPHFITLRPIIEKQLKRKNITLNMRNMKAEFGEAKDSEKLNVYKSYLLKYPPVLGEWMIENFPNIVEWYKARSSFTRSLAVMSIVGYLIGVGDRHLDNIMLNKNTGMIMHIDFDCMFEKGKKLGVPEIVPFRLTPNLIEAMGVLGYEGSFRKSCELTMSIIRDNENILMNFLESFIHDPLMDWRGSSNAEGRGEEKNQLRIKRQQERVYKILRRKICGILSKDDDNTGYRDSGGLSVSVNLQVDLLIQTAVNHENLSKMFFGWMPFL